jgi:hypothetical protein
MSEEVRTEYFIKSGTVAPSITINIDLPTPTSTPPNIIKIEIGPSPTDDLINQNIVKVDDYRKIKATRKVIGHVHFEPD